MNCPNCHCPRGEPLTVATNSLVTRCQHAFHAAVTAPSVRAEPVSVSPVAPEDFARPEPNADVGGDYGRCSSRYHSWRCDKTEDHPGEHHSIAGARRWTSGLDFMRQEPAQAAHCSVCLRQLDDGHCRTEACPRFDGAPTARKSTWHENSPRALPDPQTYKRSDTTLESPYTTPPHPTHHGAAKTVVGVYCPVHGQDRCSHAGECVGLVCMAQVHGEAKVVVCTGCGSSDGGHPLDCPTRVEFPYTTPVPSPTANGANGFRWCHSCQSVAEVAGHECAPAVLVINGSCSPEELAALKGEIGGVIVAAPSDMGWGISEGRRERAEFAESLLCAMAFDHGLERFRRHFGGVEGYCHGAEECVFCGAARGGGR